LSKEITSKVVEEGVVPAREWKVFGYDTFDHTTYDLFDCETESEAVEFASKRLKHLEEIQPTASSGGQSDSGIQDRVYIMSPDGSRYRFTE
jgi:hypothetical protein